MVARTGVDVRIRAASVKDAPGIRALEKRVWGHEVTNKYDMPIFIRHGWTFVAVHKGVLVGAIVAIATREGNACVLDWVVLPSFRHHRVGVRLYAALCKAARGRAVECLVDSHNAPSIAAHRALGFKAVKRVKDAYGAECHALDFGPHVLFRRSSTRKN